MERPKFQYKKEDKSKARAECLWSTQFTIGDPGTDDSYQLQDMDKKVHQTRTNGGSLKLHFKQVQRIVPDDEEEQEPRGIG